MARSRVTGARGLGKRKHKRAGTTSVAVVYDIVGGVRVPKRDSKQRFMGPDRAARDKDREAYSEVVSFKVRARDIETFRRGWAAWAYAARAYELTFAEYLRSMLERASHEAIDLARDCYRERRWLTDRSPAQFELYVGRLVSHLDSDRAGHPGVVCSGSVAVSGETCSPL